MQEQDLFQAVYNTKEKIAAEVYVVGGYVRDQLIARKRSDDFFDKFTVVEEDRIKPALEQDVTEDEGHKVEVHQPERTKDIDFVVEGSGVEFAEKFEQEVAEDISLVTFEQFDTARCVLDNIEIEFAGARKESYDKDSRKPKVQSANLQEDLKRRDFTVNAMAQKIRQDGLGEIIDPFSGKEHIKEEILTTPLDPVETFEEDPLRMLRAARFASKLEFEIEEETYQAIGENRERLKIVSEERVRDEFLKLLSTPKPSIGLWVLYNTQLINEFLSEISQLAGVEEREGITHKDNLKHTFEVVDNLAQKTNKTLLRFAGLLHDIGKPETKEFESGRGWTFDMHEHVGRKIVYEVGDRLKLSKDDTEYIAKLVRWHQQPVQLIMERDEISDSALRKLVIELEDDLDDLLKLCRSDITTSNPDREEKYKQNYDELEARIIEVIKKDKLRQFQSPVDGEEIMEICDLNPGPTVGKLKDKIENAILEGEIPNEKKAAEDYLQEIKEEYLSQAEEWELDQT
jgi:putative nucleotidyltransferase with HDIG domain